MSESYKKRIAELEQRCQDLETIIDTTSEHADFIEAELEKRNEFIRHVFGRYVTQEVVDTILSVPDNETLGGERREITILSSDLRGFTALAELLPAEDIIQILNGYLGIMSEAIANRGGTVGGFLGDGIIVYFGAPIEMADHARRAILCALSMQAAMSKVNADMKARGYPALEMGIGINTGEVVIGNVGSEKRAQYGAVGKAVNLAFRIESYSVGGDILASEATLQAAGSGILLLGSTRAHPKGCPGPIMIYSIGGMEEAPALTIRSTDAELIELKDPPAVKIWRVYEKDIAPDFHAGYILGIGRNVAVLRFGDDVPLPSVFSNLRLELFEIGEAYVKVTALEEAQGRIVVRLTQQSHAVERWMDEILKA